MNKAIKKAVKKRMVSLTKAVLARLIEMPGEFADIFLEVRKGYFSQFYPERQITLKQINRSLRELEKQRLIRKKQNREKMVYEVTNLGKAKAFTWQYKLQAKQARHDGLATIVIFDIPEPKRKARNFLRRFLRDNDFTQFQESVYIGRFYLLKEFDELLDELRIREYVSVLEGRIPHRR